MRDRGLRKVVVGSVLVASTAFSTGGFVVGSTGIAGADEVSKCSATALLSAIANAESDQTDTVQIACTKKITLDSPIVVGASTSLTLVGTGAGTVISGGKHTQLFSVATDGVLNLQDLTLTEGWVTGAGGGGGSDGFSGDDGALGVNGANGLTLVDELGDGLPGQPGTDGDDGSSGEAGTGGTGGQSVQGGAIYAAAGSTVTVTSSTFSDERGSRRARRNWWRRGRGWPRRSGRERWGRREPTQSARQLFGAPRKRGRGEGAEAMVGTAAMGATVGPEVTAGPPRVAPSTAPAHSIWRTRRS